MKQETALADHRTVNMELKQLEEVSTLLLMTKMSCNRLLEAQVQLVLHFKQLLILDFISLEFIQVQLAVQALQQLIMQYQQLVMTTMKLVVQIIGLLRIVGMNIGETMDISKWKEERICAEQLHALHILIWDE